MNADAINFLLNGSANALAIYEALETAVLTAWPDVRITVHGSQITFANRHGFAFVSLPRRKGEVGLVVSFGLPSRAESPRVAAVVEPYPGRWTHHVQVRSVDEVDRELMGWIGAAYAFSRRKR